MCYVLSLILFIDIIMNKKIILIISLLILLTLILILIIFLVKTTTGQINEVKIVEGEIKKLSTQQITILPINQQILSTVKTQEQKTFEINKKTKYFIATDQIKSQKEFELEQANFNNKIELLQAQQKSTTGLAAPSWFKLKTVKLSDLQIGQLVSLYLNFQDKNKNSQIIKKIVIEKKIFSRPIMGKILSELQGQIKQLQENQIVLLTAATVTNQATSSLTTEKEVIIKLDNQTKVFKNKRKSQKQFEREQEEFNQKIKQLLATNKAIDNLAAPSWFSQEPKSLADLKTGEFVLIKTYQASQESQYIAEKIIISD